MSPRASPCVRGQIVFVSSNRWDVMGAAAFGFRTLWVNRTRLPDEYAEHPPLRTVPDLSVVASIEVLSLSVYRDRRRRGRLRHRDRRQ